MSNLICIDLMKTLVFPPDENAIRIWLEQNEMNLTDFQKQLYLRGFPFAILANSENEFLCLRNKYLCNDEQYDGDLRPKEKQCIESYIDLVFRECKFNGQVLELLDLLRKKADLIIISNLFGRYKDIPALKILSNHVDSVVLSCEQKVMKPNKKIFEAAQYNKYENKYFVGDTWKSDIVVPYLLGFKCIYVGHEERFITTLYKEGCAALIEKNNEEYRIKSKYREMVKYYLGDLIENMDNLSEFLYLDNNKVFFKFMKYIKVVRNINEACVHMLSQFEINKS